MTTVAPTVEQFVLNNKCVILDSFYITANNKTRKYAETHTAPHKVEQYMNGQATFPSVLMSMIATLTMMLEGITD